VPQSGEPCSRRPRHLRRRSATTASGPFFGPPSNKPIDISVFDLARVADSQIIEHREVPDHFALLAQTGMPDRLAR
jgi:predicted ester cyclase